MTEIPLGSVALSLAASGFAVFPLLPGTKEPATRRGFIDSTRDYGLIRDWWKAGPAFNVGIDCGKSGIVVVDADPIDPPTPGHETGLDHLLDLADSLGADRAWLWSGPHVATPRGGFHLYFRVPSDRTIPSKIGSPATKIDVKATGGYVVAPWSALTDGPGRSAGEYLPIGWDHTVHGLTDLETVTAPLMSRIDVTPNGLPVLPTWLADAIDPPTTPLDPWQQLDRRLDMQPVPLRSRIRCRGSAAGIRGRSGHRRRLPESPTQCGRVPSRATRRRWAPERGNCDRGSGPRRSCGRTR